MATVTPGQLVTFLPYGLASARIDPLRTPARVGGFAARHAGSLLITGGAKAVAGVTKVAGAAVARRVVIMTQPPQSAVVYESDTILPGAAFTFPNLAAGKYVVLDIALDGSQQALVYDWVVAV